MLNVIKDMKIGKRLSLGFGLVLVLLAVEAMTGFVGMKQIHGRLEEVIEDNVHKLGFIQDMSEQVHIVARVTRTLVLLREDSAMQQEKQKIEASRKTYDEAEQALDKLPASDTGKAIRAKIKEAKLAARTLNNKVIDLALARKDVEAISLILKEAGPATQKWQDALDENIAFQKENNKKDVEAAERTYSRLSILIFSIAGIALILGVLTTVLITRGITHPLGEAVHAANKLADNDLTVNIEVNSKDETGQLLAAMKNMAEKLKKIMADVKSTADSVASASNQLSASSEQMSRGVTEQSGRASQIAASSTEMSQTVIDIAKNSSDIASSATETSKVAKDGEGIVGKSVEEVKAIANTVNESAQMMTSLGERSRQIGEIISVIKDIADQTNLLALNAAIEAARAGEQGRGFAVVADEVRKLAERTAKATSEIGDMIKAIQDEVENAVTSMNEGTERVNVGVELSTQAGNALHDIVKSVNNLQTMVQQVASATEEMSTVSETISGDIETIASVSKETSAGSEQIAQASSDLARLASNLQNIVGQFKV
ncbi:MAG: methyl-accepting chemotaxis protein [Nitrospiraceae bacterium]|nr:methyl-accepting chemotaxis protein [Nitrospirota bacterium]MDA8338577.1 methyl-accepting chemotaxis protein [Nitrospiraceae bacterium]